jgi:hypothetical protein
MFRTEPSLNLGEPEETELCAGPPAAFRYDNGPGRCGMVLPGGLQLGPPVNWVL